ncbi:sn-glycerol-3-phosphate ABC transporter ATP-binding protein UgpC [Rhizobium sp. ICMP 5592]|uniref:ABC transporter ATP-binding protein n=1 Tax=Rhizobium sp. ICMP 5592 TaxID=2292445 RepID=UPI001297E5CE|nr:sn-glycerol-3-phosphate ABC transporter ATP-binding protein UgpC [Rhizobium sp. ICMP 5592]MQB40306.1 sn-glycerol-3-phosphate ABC transporter ATP-binding protein UgpC [Rhizobium sp. ICMP 5592]
MGNVTLNRVTKQFGAASVIKGVDLAIEDGEFCVFVGPSGCGKSTLLRMIAGLEDISSGELKIGGNDMTRVGPAERGVAMVFQSYALYPHMTVAENIGFGLRMTGHSKDEVARRTDAAAEMLQLKSMLDRKPSQLSGGQRQRVAIGRAIVRNPQVFLFDEPLSNLDASLRVQMRTEISKLHQDIRTTMIYVTHDQVEAMTMADKIVVLQGGLVEQVGSPLELYHRPKNIFVAGFIGSPKMNFLKTKASPVAGGVKVDLPGGQSITLQGGSVKEGQPVTLGIRPEHLDRSEGGDATLQGKVRLAEYLGSETMFYIALADGTEIAVKADGLAQAKPGDDFAIHIPAAACHLFDDAGNAILNGDLTK